MGDASVELPILAAKLKAAGELGVRSAMVKQLREAAKPVVAHIQGEAGVDLPQRGGLAQTMALRKPKVQVRTAGRTAGVRIRSQVKGNYTNTGTWRHPVFGNRKTWAEQSYGPGAGWWERGGQEATPEAAAAMDAVLAQVAAMVRVL